MSKGRVACGYGRGISQGSASALLPQRFEGWRSRVDEVVRAFDVTLVNMGQTHYNEIASDERALYSATRSTGQIEEGPVGYSVIQIDGDVVSWRFVELGQPPVVVITSPSDERLWTSASELPQQPVKVRAKFWGDGEKVIATVDMDGRVVRMGRIVVSNVSQADFPTPDEGIHLLQVRFEDASGNVAGAEIRVAVGRRTKRDCMARDQDKVLEVWPEHGLLGTQLGPNKNGKKW